MDITNHIFKLNAKNIPFVLWEKCLQLNLTVSGQVRQMEYEMRNTQEGVFLIKIKVYNEY